MVNYARIVEDIENAGGEFLRLQDDSAIFLDGQTGRELSLPMSAVTSENVRLALENAREQVAPQRVATDIDPVELEIYKHLDSIFGPDDVDFVAKELRLPVRNSRR